MSAQPIHGHEPVRIPNTIKGIRAALPAAQRAGFDDGWQNVDLGDLPAVAAFRDKWWGRAMWASDPEVDEIFAAMDRGEVEFFPSPFAKR
jgi:hypothetical protein